MKKQWIWRGGIYVAGFLLLALGATLGTKSRLGCSPITSVPFALSGAAGIKLSVAVFLVYTVFLALEFLIRGRHRRWRDLLQLPVSLMFSSMIGVLDKMLPAAGDALWQKLMVLAVSIVLTGIGISMIINMDLVPNPPDGVVQTVCWATKKDMGLCKNVMDILCVATSILMDLLFGTIWTSVGLGTVASSLFIGRVVAVFNRCCREKMLQLAGMKK